MASEKRRLNDIGSQAWETVASEQVERLHLVTAQTLLSFISTLEPDAARKEHAVRGYKFNVNYQTMDQDEKVQRTKDVSQVTIHGADEG